MVSQLGSGIQPVGTTAYMGRAEQLMQCHSDVKKGRSVMPKVQSNALVVCTLKTESVLKNMAVTLTW